MKNLVVEDLLRSAVGWLSTTFARSAWQEEREVAQELCAKLLGEVEHRSALVHPLSTLLDVATNDRPQIIYGAIGMMLAADKCLCMSPKGGVGIAFLVKHLGWVSFAPGKKIGLRRWLFDLDVDGYYRLAFTLSNGEEFAESVEFDECRDALSTKERMLVAFDTRGM